MTLLESDKIKIKILFALNHADTELTMNSLRTHVGLVNYNSLVRNCEFLELIEFIYASHLTIIESAVSEVVIDKYKSLIFVATFVPSNILINHSRNPAL